jgi:hypothetical protein
MGKHVSRRLVMWLGIVGLILGLLCPAVVLVPWSVRLIGEEVRKEVYSPDGKYVASVFVRNGGATTGYLTHVNIRSKWSYFNPAWYGTISQGEVFKIECWCEIDPVWTDDSHLLIRYQQCRWSHDSKDPGLMRSESWNDINISYVRQAVSNE